MNKILIETARLQMREFCQEDIDAVYEFLIVPEVGKYSVEQGLVKNKQDAQDVINNIWLAEYKKYGYARYALIHKADSKVIGYCGIKYRPNILGPGVGCPDIGYRMLPEYRGQGLGTEAIKACLNYAREKLGLTRIIGEVAEENIASNKLLLKLGFKLTEQYEKNGFKLNRYE